jgi:AraC-like DNA-binding protein
MTEHNQYQSYRIDVPQDFEEVFTHFYFAGNRSAETVTKTLLPSYQTILIFNFGNKAILYSGQDTQIEIEQCLVLGPIKQAFDYALPTDSAILVANFKEDAFYRFFGAAAIAEHVPMDPDELLEENCFSLLWHELRALDEVDKQVSQALEFCRPYLRSRNDVASQLANFSNGTLNPIKVIARENNHSERSIQLHHKKYFGYSAKELNRYQRFLKAIRMIQSTASDNKKMDWHEITETCGYYDQSQLIHDFNHYIHLSPARYLKFQQDICSAMP